MITRARMILAASSAALLAFSAGAAFAQEAPPTDEAPRARQLAPDRPLRQGERARARDDAGPGFNVERLKKFLDENPEAKQELLRYLQQQTDRPLGQRGPQTDRPMRGQGQGQRGPGNNQPNWRGQGQGPDAEGPQVDRQRLRQFMQNHPEARERLLELQEQHPQARGRLGEFLQEHPQALRRLMQSEGGERFQERRNAQPPMDQAPRQGRRQFQDDRPADRGPQQFDGQRIRQFMQQNPEARERVRGFIEEHPEVRGRVREFLQEHPNALRRLMQGEQQGRTMRGQRGMQDRPQMRGQRQGQFQQRQPQMRGQQGQRQQMDAPFVCPHCQQPIFPQRMMRPQMQQRQERPQRSFRGQPDQPLPPAQLQPRRRAQ